MSTEPTAQPVGRAGTGRGSGFLGAAQFLTRVPVRLRTPPQISRCVPWFPVVGGLLGLLIGLVAAGLTELVPPAVAAALAVLLGVSITGAFHEDGLADLADAAGGWTVERRREILKDSRLGSYGVAAMTGSIALRIACVATLAPSAAVAGLVAAHALGRGAAVGAMGASHDPAPPGLGADYTSSVSPARATTGALIAVVIAAVATGWWAGPLTIAAIVAGVAVARYARRAIGAVTGDALGAIEQVAECLVLVVVTGLAARHTVWWA